MPVERREQAIDIKSGQPVLGQPGAGGTRCSPEGGSLRRWHEPDEARVSRPDL